MKAGFPEPLDHADQVDERSSRGLIKNANQTGHRQASFHGRFSRLPIIKDHLIRQEVFRQENRFALARVKVAQILGYPWSDRVEFQPGWRHRHPASYNRRRVWMLELCRHRLGDQEPLVQDR